jgi:hypothetical protein
MRRRDLVRGLLSLAAASVLLPLGSAGVSAQEGGPTGVPGTAPGTAPATGPAAAGPEADSGVEPLRPTGEPAAPPSTASGDTSAPSSTPAGDGAQPAPDDADQGPLRNNIVGLNVSRLHQPLYIWAASDLVNANGGDWGYITVVWTMEDRDGRNAELNLQLFLDRCFEFHVQPIVRVATKFEALKDPTRQTAAAQRPGAQGAEGSWIRPDWDEPAKWRDFFERGNWPARHVWIVVGNEPNLGREWGGAVDAASYARYLGHFVDVFKGAPRFDVVGGALDISNTTALPVMQDALEFLDAMQAAVPDIFERLPAWASNPYRVLSRGPGVRFTHLAYEAELDRIGREMPVLITECGHLDTGDELEIARFYEEAFLAWMADPKVVAATPLFWHPDRNDFWMFELDKKGAFIHRSPTYELMRRLPRLAGSARYGVTIGNTARTTPFEVVTAAAASPAEPDAGAATERPAARSEPESQDPGTSARAASELTQGAEAPASAAPEAAAERPVEPPSSRAQGGGSPAGPDARAGTDPGTTAASPATAGADARAARSRAPSLRIANTGGQGARLRAAPSREAESITVLPDGAAVEALGPVRQSADESWRPVRAADGAEGWVASELLVPAGAESE